MFKAKSSSSTEMYAKFKKIPFTKWKKYVKLFWAQGPLHLSKKIKREREVTRGKE